jgi:hypothetical protein
LSKATTKRTGKALKAKKASRIKSVVHKPKRMHAYKVIDAANSEIIGKAYENGTQIIVEDPTHFVECVKLLQGSNAIVFRTTHQYGLMRTQRYSTVYFFPYQGYLILYSEPQG